MTIAKPDSGYRLADARSIIEAITNLNQTGYGAAASAAGTNQATATIIPAGQPVYEITTAGANTGVNLPISAPGKVQFISNNGANTVTIYTNASETAASPKIDSIAGATGVPLAVGSSLILWCATSGQWYTTGSGSGAYTGTFNGTVGASAPSTGAFTSLTSTSFVGPAPTGVGATLAVTAALAGQTLLLNTAAGSVATLPAASGTGNKYKFVVSATAASNKHAILAASVSDFINGLSIGENAGTCKAFASAAATNHSIQMPFAGTQPSGGFIGDYFEFQDIAANLWQVNGMYQAGVTPTTPFSTSLS